MVPGQPANYRNRNPFIFCHNSRLPFLNLLKAGRGVLHSPPAFAQKYIHTRFYIITNDIFCQYFISKAFIFVYILQILWQSQPFFSVFYVFFFWVGYFLPFTQNNFCKFMFLPNFIYFLRFSYLSNSLLINILYNKNRLIYGFPFLILLAVCRLDECYE